MLKQKIKINKISFNKKTSFQKKKGNNKKKQIKNNK